MECRRLLEDRDGNIWVATKQADLNGLAKWDSGQRRIIDLSPRLPDKARANAITAFTGDGESVWLGLGRPGGLLRLRGETIEEIPGIPPGTVNALDCNRRGHVWVATAEAGLAEVDASGARPVNRVYDARSHLSSNEVWCITEDRLGRVYAGTARGVDRIDPSSGAMLHYSVEDGLAEGDIRSALCDRNGDLWFLSNQGLSRLLAPPNGRRRRPSLGSPGFAQVGSWSCSPSSARRKPDPSASSRTKAPSRSTFWPSRIGRRRACVTSTG